MHDNFGVTILVEGNKSEGGKKLRDKREDSGCDAVWIKMFFLNAFFFTALPTVSYPNKIPFSCGWRGGGTTRRFVPQYSNHP